MVRSCLPETGAGEGRANRSWEAAGRDLLHKVLSAFLRSNQSTWRGSWSSMSWLHLLHPPRPHRLGLTTGAFFWPQLRRFTWRTAAVSQLSLFLSLICDVVPEIIKGLSTCFLSTDQDPLREVLSPAFGEDTPGICSVCSLAVAR